LEVGDSALRGRSYCPHCKHTLSPTDLIPLLSFLFLKGRCRYCKGKISWQYPLVEAATGILFVSIFNFQFPIFNQLSIFNFQTISLLYSFFVVGILIVVFVYDLKHYIIPDKVIYPAIVITFIYQLFGIWKLDIGNFELLTDPFIAGSIASIFFLAIVLISRGTWMGLGDVKLAFWMGLVLGFPHILVALFLAFWLGAIIGIGLIVAGKRTLKSEVPFGPFLVIGTFITLFWGEKLMSWYFSLFT